MSRRIGPAERGGRPPVTRPGTSIPERARLSRLFAAGPSWSRRRPRPATDTPVPANEPATARLRAGRLVTPGRLAAAVVVSAAWIGLAGPASALLSRVPDSSAGPSATAAAAAPSLGGWNVTADGNAVDIDFDNATGLAGVHPFTEADFPEAESQFATGPFGSGLATVFWPGSAGGNFGSLSSELGFPSQLQPVASQLNDPVKASAMYPSGPDSSRYPAGSSGGAAVMEATAGPGGTTAEGSVTDENPSIVLSFSSAKGTSSAVASSTATAQSASDVSGVSLLGGLVDIGSITSSAQASSDGTTGTGSATTDVTGVTMLGQATTIGSTGITIPDYPSSLAGLTGPIVANALSQVISGLGLTITEFPSTESASGAGYTATSGGVSVEIDPPSSAATTLEQAASVLAPYFPSQAAIIPTLPGLLQGGTLTITLGRATASADASPAFSFSFNPPPPPASSTGGNSTSPVSGTATAVPSAVSASTPGGLSSGPTPVAATATGGTAPAGGSTPTVASPPAALIRLSTPLGAGVVAAGILVTLAAGFGLLRLARMLLPGDTEPICPLGQDRS